MTQSQPFTPADLTTSQRMSAPEAIQYHYDNDTRFFSLWLDQTLSYSSARWRVPLSPEAATPDLAAAQADKIDFHLDAAAIRTGGSLIDVGCGWGAVLRAAVEQRGAAFALGLTLSNDQRSHIVRQDRPGISVALEDIFAFRTDRRFDAAISIGAFEHFARPEMDRAAKRATYGRFFEVMHGLLVPGARLSLQTIVWDALTFDEAKRWIPQTVFPQSDIPFIAEVVDASADTFRLVYLENDPRDYAMTLEAWILNLRAARGTILEEWGEAKYDFFEHYLRNSRLAFLRRKNSLARFVLERR